MPVEKVRIEFSENDLKDIIAEKYGLKRSNIRLSVYHYEGDSREPSYTTVTIEAEKEKTIKNG